MSNSTVKQVSSSSNAVQTHRIAWPFRPLKVYLAGKISKQDDWRESIYRGTTLSADDSLVSPDPWPEGEDFVFDEIPLVYTGPWFIGCDHGCYHGGNRHGSLDGCMGDMLQLPGCDPEDTGDDARWRLPQLCMGRVEQADIVFAWINQPESYGTIFELGFRLGTKKRAYLCSPWDYGGREEHGWQNDCKEWWFTERACGLFTAESPRFGFSQVLKHVCENEGALHGRKCAEGMCQSPIEKQMLNALLLLFKGYSWECRTWTKAELSLYQQRPAGSYTLDFAIEGPGVKVAVECDGHDYHERTKDQAAHDKSRDRWLTENGWRVLRFTGSEIHKDACRCAKEAVRIAETILKGQAAE